MPCDKTERRRHGREFEEMISVSKETGQMSSDGKRILIVDDEKTLLHTFSNSLKAYSSNLEIVTAENGLQAVDILRSLHVDLVVTDLKMPGMDGFQLLIHMKKHFPDMPVIVMTAVGSPEVADRLRSLGTVSYLEKPINIKDLALKIFQGFAAASEGRIFGVTLAGFLQLVVMEQKSCALKIRSGNKSGTLLIKNGDLIDAKTEDLSGEAAACDIVTWEDTEIRMGNYTGERTKKIDAALSEILIDAFRMRDERERAARKRRKPAEGAVAGGEELHEEEEAAEPEGKAPARGADKKGSGPAQDAGAGEDAPAAPPADRGRTLRDLLSGLSRLQGVTAACLVGRDGFLIDGVFNANIEAELVGAIGSASFAAAASIGRELGNGELEITMLEFEQSGVIVAPVGNDFLLVIAARKDANFGMLRIKIKKLGREIEAAAEAV